ncbi:MAG: AI-2E family transporter [Pseudoxanthomonas suwonensis]|nr:AI-2E family transporter [Pseudoxanthomonas suwonensis]
MVRPRSSPATLVLAVLAIMFTLWAAQGVILPILLAAFFALIGNPLLRLLCRLRLPRFLGALLLLVLAIAALVTLGRQLATPAAEWIAEAPRTMRMVVPKLRKMIEPVQQASQTAEDIARAAGGENPRRPVQVVRTEENAPFRALSTTPKLLGSVLAVVLLTFFFMVYGERLQRSAIALLRERQRKVLTTDIMQSIEREMSRYVLTITMINVGLGLVVAAALHWLAGFDAQEALLWGTATALLNYAPYVGPFIGFALLLLAGLVKFDSLAMSLLPAGMYVALQTIEGQLVTPIVLGRQMALSPLIVILALLIFSWAWGLVGLLLAIPLLVCVKIVLGKVEEFEGWARLLE